MEQNKELVIEYCGFYDSECIKERCPAYLESKPLSSSEARAAFEMGLRHMTYLKHWCLRYDKAIAQNISEENKTT
jgi:hypothetical protein